MSRQELYDVIEAGKTRIRVTDGVNKGICSDVLSKTSMHNDVYYGGRVKYKYDNYFTVGIINRNGRRTHASCDRIKIINA